MSTSQTLAAAIEPVVSGIVNMPEPRRSWYAINHQEGANEAEIFIYDEIGGWGITARQFIAELRQIKAGTITVRLNSPGGEVIEGTAIYNALRSHGAKVNIRIEGMALSTGSFIAMAGDEVQMASNAYMMIHNAWGGVVGDAKEMRGYADVLDKMNDNIAGMYETKTGTARKHWRGLMDSETWFTAKEAKEQGLVDSVYDAGSDAAAKHGNKFLNVYTKVPDAVRIAWTTKSTTPDASHVATVPPVAISQEPKIMATDSQASPAQSPVAVVADSSPGAETIKQTQSLREITNSGYIEQGRKVGIEEGRKMERDRLAAIVAACPGKPQMAIDAFTNGQGSEAVKMAYEVEVRADARAKQIEDQKNLEISRLHALIATGGSTGVAMSLAGVDEEAPTMEPKAQAEWEWDNKPEVRKTAKTKEIYVYARAAELEGTHRSFNRELANA